MPVQQGPPQPQPLNPESKTAALAALRQSVWEATQWLSCQETFDYVADVLREIEQDAL